MGGEVGSMAETPNDFLRRLGTGSSKVPAMRDELTQGLRCARVFTEPLELDRCSCLVIREDSRIRLFWNVAMSIMILYIATIMPYGLCFYDLRIPEQQTRGQVWSFVETMVNLLFATDICLNFFFGYTDHHGRPVNSLPKTALNYCRGFFIVDLISSMPDSAIRFLGGLFGFEGGVTGVNQTGRLLRINRLTRMLKLVRMLRLMKVYACLEKSPIWNYLNQMRCVRLLQFGLFLLLIVHWVACGWYICASLQTDPTSTWVWRQGLNNEGLQNSGPLDQWICAMYFVLTVFTSVGFGDIYATTTVEALYVSMAMVVGTIVHSVLVGEVIGVLTVADSVSTQRKQQKALMRCFAEHTHLTPAVADKFLRFIEQTTDVHRGYDRREVWMLMTKGVFPREMESELPEAFFGGKLLRNSLVKTCASLGPLELRFSLSVALAVHERYFKAEEVVYHLRDFPNNIHLVLTGVFAAIALEVQMMTEVSDKRVSMLYKDYSHTTSNARPMGYWFSRDEQHKRETPPAEPVWYPYQLYCGQSYCGDVEVLLNYPVRRSSLRCEEDGSMLLLQKHSIPDLVQEFPRQMTSLRLAAVRRDEHQKNLRKWVCGGVHYRTLAAMIIQRHVRRLLLITTKRRSKRIHTGKGSICELLLMRERKVSQVSARSSQRTSITMTPSRRGPSLPPKGDSAAVEGLRREMASVREAVDELRGMLVEALQPQSSWEMQACAGPPSCPPPTGAGGVGGAMFGSSARCLPLPAQGDAARTNGASPMSSPRSISVVSVTTPATPVTPQEAAVAEELEEVSGQEGGGQGGEDILRSCRVHWASRSSELMKL